MTLFRAIRASTLAAGLLAATAACSVPGDAPPGAADESAPRAGASAPRESARALPPPAASLPHDADAGQYGAIAVGDDGYWGVGWDAATPDDAGERALEECSPGPACRVVVTIAGPMCGAYAEGRTTAGGGVAATRPQAEQLALAQCSRGGGRSCSVRAWVCNAQP